MPWVQRCVQAAQRRQAGTLVPHGCRKARRRHRRRAHMRQRLRHGQPLARRHGVQSNRIPAVVLWGQRRGRRSTVVRQEQAASCRHMVRRVLPVQQNSCSGCGSQHICRTQCRVDAGVGRVKPRLKRQRNSDPVYQTCRSSRQQLCLSQKRASQCGVWSLLTHDTTGCCLTLGQDNSWRGRCAPPGATESQPADSCPRLQRRKFTVHRGSPCVSERHTRPRYKVFCWTQYPRAQPAGRHKRQHGALQQPSAHDMQCDLCSTRDAVAPAPSLLRC